MKERSLTIKLLNRTILIMSAFICLKNLYPHPIGIFVKSALSEMPLLMFLLNFMVKKNMISILGFWNQKIQFQCDLYALLEKIISDERRICKYSNAFSPSGVSSI